MAARRAGVEERLHEVVALGKRAMPPSAMELRPHLQDKAGIVAAAAAKLAAEHGLGDLERDLEEAFSRFLVHPVKTDPGCRAKLAAAEALRKLDAHSYDVFLRGIAVRQPEPSYGPPIDTAAPLRVCCAAALLETRHSLALLQAATLLADPEPTARAGIASVLGGVGGDACEALLRVRVLVGDSEPQVIGACLQGLLCASIERELPFVVQTIKEAGEDVTRLGLLALGESRDERALPTLREYAESSVDEEVRTTALLALALSRLPGALSFLQELSEHASPARADEARAALSALGRG
jgi:HEAT repeat protein